MKLTVILPTGVLVDQEVTKVTAEAENGSFCLLPRHIDFLAALVPGLLAFENEAGEEEFLAIDEGVLVKCGAEVMVSTRNAVRGAPLGQLREAVEKQFRVLDDREQQARTVLTKLEADFVGRFIRMGEKARG
ncbi:MAG: F0F1 ATP synthase subunit epsilon [Deltaproteobacteria bacterium]|nr:F0F1 ATP synthase subunit epsilon [Deltaproteobacteria bacterium]TLN01893.1 MAG: F0F1 ATP synthase subunit epsilon [bacterium]